MNKEDRTKRESYIKGIVNNLPESPGCYQYLNDSGTIIYVGKAKNLKRRVSSYFNKEQQTLKTRLLVAKIADIRYVVVNSEADALLLENNLIKQHKPRYLSFNMHYKRIFSQNIQDKKDYKRSRALLRPLH